MRLLLPLLLLPLAAGAGAAAPPEARWGDNGQLENIRVGETALNVGGQLTIASPGWKAQADQRQAANVKRTEDGKEIRWTGTLTAPTIAAAYTQQVRQEGSRIHIDYTVEAQRAFPAAALLWRASVPIAETAGGKWIVAVPEVVQIGTLPEKRAEPYQLATETGPSWFGWLGERAGLRVASLNGSFARVQVQDNRHFNTEQFEFQGYLPLPGTLEPGHPVRFSFALDALTPEMLLAEQERIRRNQPVLKAAGPLAIRAVTPDRQEVPRFAKQELRIALSATYNNPFDPDEIDVSAQFRTPSGQVLTVPGFIYQPYTRRRDGKTERVSPAGTPEWRVRFSPVETGEYAYTVTARDRSGRVESQQGRFRCTESAGPGFVRVSKDDPRYFAFDNGAPYFALGANVCWAGGGGTYEYDEWFARYAEAGGNYARLWIGPMDSFTLERKALPDRDDTGLGRYDQADSWRLDYVLNLAERQGLYLMLCIDSFNSLRIRPSFPAWAGNPYSAANGGMLQKPEEFFNNEAARRLFRNRLRYLVARWGYSPHVLSWEFWNEVDIIEKYLSPDVARWHQEMSRYLRGIDPWKHLQTTSFAGSGGDAAVDGIPEMDYVQTHRYGPRDMAAEISQWSRRKREAFAKPHYVGEFGLDSGGAGADRDPNGVSLHNGMWAGVMSGDAGAAMLWWWDSYIHPRNLYGHLAALAAFSKGIDWPRAHFRPAGDWEVAFTTRPTRPDRQDLFLMGLANSWDPSPANQPNTFIVPRTGKMAESERLSRLLHGVQNHPQLHNPATFQVDYATAGRCLVNVRGVSGHGGAALKVILDGRTVLEKDFPDPDGTEKTDTLDQYNGAYAVEIPAGKHAITVENTGKDWLYADYTLPAYQERWEPRLRSFGLVGDRQILAWVQHTDHTWSRLADGVRPEPQAGAELYIPGVRADRCRVEFWDTYQGVRVREQVLPVNGGRLTIPLPAITQDLAIKATLLP